MLISDMEMGVGSWAADRRGMVLFRAVRGLCQAARQQPRAQSFAGVRRQLLDRTHWRGLPATPANRNSVFRQLPRCTTFSLWSSILKALADSGGEANLLQMIDSTSI
ncbi:MAG TPA: hypothetical protein VNR89_22725 [Roseomonas sp.]|nr:hypothetical protein [Roseomonas sp.]